MIGQQTLKKWASKQFGVAALFEFASFIALITSEIFFKEPFLFKSPFSFLPSTSYFIIDFTYQYPLH